MSAAELYIGLMSGTSLDGVDAALVQIGDGELQFLGKAYSPYTESMRQAALALHEPGPDDLHHACMLANQIADIYAETVAALLESAGTEARHIKALGAHGQTVRHNPAAGYTLQLLNGARLAELSAIKVVSDFRSRDIAAGGQGAPLVPAFHDAMLRHPHEHRIVLNLGGIANITDLAPGKPTRGFDTGPANMLLDAWIKHQRGLNYDEHGAWAASGQINEDLLLRMLTHVYFAQAAPKSCGREEFNLAWLQSLLRGNEAPQDVQATLLELSVRSIADAINTYCGQPDTLLVCGGGALNPEFMSAITHALPRTIVSSTDSAGLASDAVEAIAFAWLAQRTLHNLTGSLAEVTGASGGRILGAIYPC